VPIVSIIKGVDRRRGGRGGNPVVANVQAIGRAKPRELAHRVTSFVEVTLLWRKLDNVLTLRLVEVGTGIEFEFGVRPEDALEAFNHPYAYLPAPGLGSLDLLAA
jgi:hypothetical protein